jgi:leucyl-tRNA synthetase
LIAPVAPAVAEECWNIVLATKGADRSWSSVFDTAWPEVDDRSIFDIEDIKCAVQIDGKTRFVLDVPGLLADKKDELIKLVSETPEGIKWIQERQIGEPSDVIVALGGRIINFVFKQKTTRGAKT